MTEEVSSAILDIKNPTIDLSNESDGFYLKYYSGHRGKFGHEFLEFTIDLKEKDTSAKLKYINNSNYRREDLIHKEMRISIAIVQEIKKILHESEVLKESDAKWPPKSADGMQELIIKSGKHKKRFEVTKIGSLADVKKSEDADGLRVFYYVTQDIKALIFSLISLHFKLTPY